jgi:hypothetical protein
MECRQMKHAIGPEKVQRAGVGGERSNDCRKSDGGVRCHGDV